MAIQEAQRLQIPIGELRSVHFTQKELIQLTSGRADAANNWHVSFDSPETVELSKGKPLAVHGVLVFKVWDDTGKIDHWPVQKSV